MFAKRPTELTDDDMHRVIAENVQEGSQVELKRTLPAKQGNDPWVNGKDSVSDRARNELVAEVIAFANAHGGWLLVGVDETKDKPSRACGLVPLRNCSELAERLRLMCRDCIEPQLPILEVAGVPLEETGAGVVVFRVPRSRVGPHRHIATRECYVRRADRTEKMTMREIQDLTLQVERGMLAVDTRLAKRREDFNFAVPKFLGDARGFGMRVTAVPITPISIERVHKKDALEPVIETLGATLGNYRFELELPIQYPRRRPILRGTRSITTESDLECSLEVHDDGLIEYQLVMHEDPRNGYFMHFGWVMCLPASVMCMVERFRRAASAPDVEFALEFQATVSSAGIRVPKPFGRDFPKGGTLFPHYSLGPCEEFAAVMGLISRDFWNTTLLDPDDDLVVDFSRVFPELSAQLDDDGNAST